MPLFSNKNVAVVQNIFKVHLEIRKSFCMAGTDNVREGIPENSSVYLAVI